MIENEKSATVNSLYLLRKKDSSVVELLLHLSSVWESFGLEKEGCYRTLVRSLNSELDSVPYGENRKYFSEKYLKEQDLRLEKILSLNKKNIENLIEYLKIELIG